MPPIPPTGTGAIIPDFFKMFTATAHQEKAITGNSPAVTGTLLYKMHFLPLFPFYSLVMLDNITENFPSTQSITISSQYRLSSISFPTSRLSTVGYRIIQDTQLDFLINTWNITSGIKMGLDPRFSWKGSTFLLKSKLFLERDCSPPPTQTCILPLKGHSQFFPLFFILRTSSPLLSMAPVARSRWITIKCQDM